jgi:hypothetical protein
MYSYQDEFILRYPYTDTENIVGKRYTTSYSFNTLNHKAMTSINILSAQIVGKVTKLRDIEFLALSLFLI